MTDQERLALEYAKDHLRHLKPQRPPPLYEQYQVRSIAAHWLAGYAAASSALPPPGDGLTPQPKDDAIQWKGSNLPKILDFLRKHFGVFPRDWVEETPDGTLAIMGDDSLMHLDRTQWLIYRDGKLSVNSGLPASPAHPEEPHASDPMRDLYELSKADRERLAVKLVDVSLEREEAVKEIELLKRQLHAVDSFIGFPSGEGHGRIELIERYAPPGVSRDALLALLEKIRYAANHQRVLAKAGIACQSEHAWHAREYDEWANELAALVGPVPEVKK